ncbi:hypothetical protein [Mycolicibacterium elephantis]|uniref:hypothetical protein n=1 Tax=Mycolicibacterium elephantis TaxID=81858 RepID=UPI0010553A8D|nr:hypothetical protein [Mycolicibacterium elephantis]
MTLPRPCTSCGDLHANPRGQCDTCTPTTKQRGYDSAHQRLSRQLRRAQPFCETCGATTDLQLDHLPGSWERVAAGKRLRPGIDVAVVCGFHNRERARTRPVR